MKKYDIPKPETKLMTSIFRPNYNWADYQPPFEDSDLYESIEGITLKSAISTAQNCLSNIGGPSQHQRAMQVLKMRFGLNGNQPMTLKATGCMFGLGAERIRQIQAKALRILRYPKHSRLLKSYIKPSTPKENE